MNSLDVRQSNISLTLITGMIQFWETDYFCFMNPRLLVNNLVTLTHNLNTPVYVLHSEQKVTLFFFFSTFESFNCVPDQVKNKPHFISFLFKR